MASPKLRCLSEYIEAYSALTKNFSTDSSTGDNSWFKQPAFQSSNITSKRSSVTGPLKQEHYKLPPNFHCRLSELYSGGHFIQIDALQDLVRAKIGDDNHNVTDTTHLSLEHSLKYGINTRNIFDNRNVIFPDTIPLLNPKPPKFPSSQTYALFHKIKKGSNAYRKVLDRNIDFITPKRLAA
jgi:hypothetical protein